MVRLSMKQHEFALCRAFEVPITKATLDHDTFIDGTTLNYEEIEGFEVCVAEYAKALAKTACRASVELVGDNVVDLEAYRNERNRPTAA